GDGDPIGCRRRGRHFTAGDHRHSRVPAGVEDARRALCPAPPGPGRARLLYADGGPALLAPLVLGPNYSSALHMELFHPLQGPSGAHLLGTDDLGRDELAALLLATRVTLLPALVALVLATLIGAAVLAVLARLGRSRFAPLARAFEVLSTPLLILVLLVGVDSVTPWPQQRLLLRAIGFSFTLWVRPDPWWGSSLPPSPPFFALSPQRVGAARLPPGPVAPWSEARPHGRGRDSATAANPPHPPHPSGPRRRHRPVDCGSGH